ncbi:hypothetical protein [Alicyclobacillus acidiphilus]|uniref:hypothetical protein n=1 Tax=Alicyclobacillus acidiphilus TaxID=182455 RepID=UPI00082F3426|nr:hypothetical protein [Alicyclobacillus acidiphilus]
MIELSKLLSIFVGFRHDEKVIGSTWKPYEHEFPERRAKVLEMVEKVDVHFAREIYDHIEWTPFTGEIRVGDAIHLINLFKRGIEGYAENQREILKFLNKNYPHKVEEDLAERVQYRDGKTMILIEASTHIFNDGEFDIAFIFDLDANRVETITNRPIPIS